MNQFLTHHLSDRQLRTELAASRDELMTDPELAPVRLALDGACGPFRSAIRLDRLPDPSEDIEIVLIDTDHIVRLELAKEDWHVIEIDLCDVADFRPLLGKAGKRRLDVALELAAACTVPYPRRLD